MLSTVVAYYYREQQKEVQQMIFAGQVDIALPDDPSLQEQQKIDPYCLACMSNKKQVMY